MKEQCIVTKMKLFFKSIAYSISLIYKSSGLLIFAYLFIGLFGATLTLLSTFILKLVLDNLSAEIPEIGVLLICVGLYVLSLVLQQANQSAQNIVYDSVFKRAEHLYECILSKKLAVMPMSIIDSSYGKDMIDDVRYTKNTAVYTGYRMVRIILMLYTFGASYITLVHFNIWFSLLFLVLTIPGIILEQVFDKKAEDLRMKTAPDLRKFCYYRWMLTDAWPAKDVRMYDLTEPITKRYNEEKKDYREANRQLDKKKLYAALFAEIIKRSGEIFFTVFVILCAISERISIGDVALYIGFAVTASDSFQAMVTIFVMGYTRSTKVMGRLFEFLDIPADDGQIGTRKLETFESLTFDNVSFRYPYTEKYVLSGASFTLNRGDKMTIIGINGSGKSTIIKLMLGLYEIDAGQILINGYPMADYNIHDVRKLFSALFQNFVQYPLTLRDNIALSDIENVKHDEAIEEALKQSGIYDDIKLKLTNGLDSFMTRRFDDCGTELSKGQWQKIALSRTYFKNAQIYIFDEPSAALDAEAEDIIFKNFESISDKKTGIMISHRISGARMSNKIIVLDGGKIVETGTHDALISIGGVYAGLYNLQKQKYTLKEGN